jgi:hypothetical protein
MRDFLLNGGASAVRWMEERSLGLLADFGGFSL